MLTREHEAQQAAFHAFAQQHIAPFATQFDHEQRIPRHLIHQLAQAGYLAAFLPEAYGGADIDFVTYGLLNQSIGAACSSVRSLLTVHGMVAYAVYRWGSTAQKARWLPAFCNGDAIAAFALSEPHAGSDINSIATTIERQGDDYIVTGTKKWITFGQIADVFLVFGKEAGGPIACLVERDTPGLCIKPRNDLLGTRASMVAELTMSACRVPHTHVIGRRGFGIAAIALSALDLGRYSVAWGCIGIGQAALSASLQYTATRQQFGKCLKEHQLVQQMITDMVTSLKAARLLCLHAGYLRDGDDVRAMNETLVAKYSAAKMAFQVATDAVQLHGGNGCSSDYPVARYLRDAKVMEIIEGSHQMQQIMIAQDAYTRL